MQFQSRPSSPGNSGRGEGQRRKGRSSSPAPNSKAKQTDGEKGDKEETSDKRSQIVCRNKKIVETRGVSFGIFPCVKITSLRPDANMATHVSSDMLRLREKPSKKSRKGGAKESVAILKDSTQLGCVCQDSYPAKSILREEGRLGSKRAIQFSRMYLAPTEKFGIERVHREELFESVRFMSLVFAR